MKVKRAFPGWMEAKRALLGWMKGSLDRSILIMLLPCYSGLTRFWRTSLSLLVFCCFVEVD
ncbi:unnamed protein product [Coffea canephora]|uniref:Uncharacterized protein n=1 Tax=Coffea canephora TaxID=49390 RepID=A0A068V3H2_COFCA|nr:unnamed protein product [Coffea canephora]